MLAPSFPASLVKLARSAASGAAMLVVSATDAPAATPEGEWVVNDGSGRIRIVDCDGSYWGIVTWESVPGLDDQNPDPAKRNRPILGMPVLLDMKPDGVNQWWGQVYDSSNGKTYSGGVRLKSAEVLRVMGCVLTIFCGGQDWKRAAADLASDLPVNADACAATASR